MSCRYQRKRDLCHGMSDPGEARAASSDLPAILRAGVARNCGPNSSRRPRVLPRCQLFVLPVLPIP